MRTVLLCLHGFMVHDRNDFGFMKKYFDQNNQDENLFLETPQLYNRLDNKTHSYKNMYKALQQAIKEHLEIPDTRVVLLGYSFNCGIIVRATNEFNLDRVILFSPTTRLIENKLLNKYVHLAISNIKLKLKHGKKAKKIMERVKLSGTISLAYNVALSIVKNKKHFKKLRCPTLMVRGMQDELTTQKTLCNLLKLIKSDDRRVIMYPSYDHHYIRFEESLVQSGLYQEVMSFVTKKEK